MRVGIIGGGVSGLAAAYAAARAGHEAAVFERASEPGGLASVCDLDGVRLEKFYHFLCAQDFGYFDLCERLGLRDRLRFHYTRTGFYYDGREFPFTTPLDLLRFTPIPLTQRIRFGLFALEARIRTEWRQLDELAAKPWLIDRVGLRAYEVVWAPLLALKFGEEHTAISAAWVWHRLHRVARSKARMGYLEGGTGVLLDALLAAIEARGGRVELGRAAARIATEGGRATGIVFEDGATFECDQVVSTLPLCALADLLPDHEAYAAQLRRVRYIGVVCVVMKLKRRVSRYFWLNVHDKRAPFNGIIEFTNLNPIGPDAGHIAYVPYYVPTDHALYTAPDAEVLERSWDALKQLNPALCDGDRIAARVFRAPYAQAICPTGFLDLMPAAHAPIEGLHLLDSTFLYPEDRTQSGLIRCAEQCVASFAGPPGTE